MRHTFALRSLKLAAMLGVAAITAHAQTPLAPYGQLSQQTWQAKYFFSPNGQGSAPSGWQTADFDDSAWDDIEGPISMAEQWQSYPALAVYGTVWAANGSSYWVRRHFNIDELKDGYLFYVIHDDGCTAYLNGVQIYNNSYPLTYPNYNTKIVTGDAFASLKEGDNVLAVYVTDGEGQALMDFGLYGYDFDDIVTRADVPFTFTQTGAPFWTAEGTTATVRGDGKTTRSTSWLTMNYYADTRTELSFSWASYNSSNHANALQLYVDGVMQASRGSSSFETRRHILPAGNHVIAFRDSIGSSNTTNNWSSVKDIKVKKIAPLESAVLTANSKPLTFTNDGAWPWTIEDGYIQNGNHDRSPSASAFATTFTVDKTSKFSYELEIPTYSDYWRSGWVSSHEIRISMNGIQMEYWTAKRDWTYDEFILEPGKYTIEFLDTLYANSGLNSHIRNIELSDSWQTVELATAGTLGYEVLSMPAFDVLTDVEMLKVVGPMNAADWTDIKNMTNLKALDLSEAVISEIPNKAFQNKTRIGSVILPEGIKAIGEYAFNGTELRRINIPSTVTTIKRNAFTGTPVQYLTFSPGSQLQTIECYAFQNCKSLQEVDLPEGLFTIGHAAFDQCSAIKRVVMPNSVTAVRAYAFQGCTSMTSIRFSDALTEIREWVCNDCYALADVHLPVALERINIEAFRDNTSLRHIDLPETLNTIVRVAFYNCGLDSLKLPIGLQWLGTEAFDNCANLKYIEFPSYIERGDYSYCYSVRDTDDSRSYSTSSSGYRSNFRNCPSLEKVVMRSATPPAIDADPFANSRAKNQITLVVPSFSVVNYKLDTYWYQFGSIIEGDDVSYWKITSPLMLTNNRRMQGAPDVDLYYGGQLTVGGSAPFTMNSFNLYVSESNPGRLLNTCDAMSATQAATKFSVTANKWFFFTPLHDVNVADISVTNDASYVIRYYDAQNRAANGASGSWKNVDTDKLTAGTGYIFHCNKDCIITFPADALAQQQLFSTADVTRQLVVNESTTTANRSWNYIGNPFPTYFDIYYMDFTAPITVWTGSTYKAYSIVDDDLVLRPMQAFFVQKPDAVDNIVFHKEGRQLSSAIERAKAPARAPQQRQRNVFTLKIQAEDELSDQTRVVLNAEASATYEVGRDAAKFMSFDTAVPQLLTLDDGAVAYAINERPAKDAESVTLAFYAPAQGTYTISALRADGSIVLHDNMTGEDTDLTLGAYNFHCDATQGVDSSRFTLQLAPPNDQPTAINATNESDNQMVNGKAYDLTGRRIRHSSFSNRGIYIINGRKVVIK